MKTNAGETRDRSSNKMTIRTVSDPDLPDLLRQLVIKMTGSIKNFSLYCMQVLRKDFDTHSEKLYKGSLGKLPEPLEKELKEICRQQREIAAEKLSLAERYLGPVARDYFLKDHNELKNREIALQRNIRSLCYQYGLSPEQSHEVSVQLLNQKYDTYLERVGAR